MLACMITSCISPSVTPLRTAPPDVHPELLALAQRDQSDPPAHDRSTCAGGPVTARRTARPSSRRVLRAEEDFCWAEGGVSSRGRGVLL